MANEVNLFWKYFKKIFIKIWNDPVFSKLIAPAIGGIFIWIWAKINSDYLYLAIVFICVTFFSLFSIILIQRYLKKGRKKLLIFISDGGTCRDPMAKIITSKFFDSKGNNIKVDIRGMAVGDASGKHVSYGARFAISSIYGEDLLSDYECETITADALKKADLILVMEKKNIIQLQKNFPDITNKNIFLFKEFFGLSGNISNPWPDKKDEKSLKKYLACAKKLKVIIENNGDILLNALQN